MHSSITCAGRLQAAEFDVEKRASARIALGDIIAYARSFDAPDKGVREWMVQRVTNRYVIAM